MKPVRILAAMAAIVCAAGAHAQKAPAAIQPVAAATQRIDPAFTDALRLYHQGRWAAAFGRAAKLADQGHPDGARLAIIMLRHGPVLYRTSWSVTQEQMELWQAAAGSAVPLHPSLHVGE